MVPRPPPHPWLGKQKLPEAKQNENKHFSNNYHAFYLKMIKMVPKVASCSVVEHSSEGSSVTRASTNATFSSPMSTEPM